MVDAVAVAAVEIGDVWLNVRLALANMSADMVLTNMVFDDGGWLVVV
jgi:hypothetical protein